MPDCTRCGADAEENPTYGDYDYCDECVDLFEEIRKNEIFVRNRHGNQDFEHRPYEVSGQGGQPNQVKALAAAMDEKEELGCRAVFHYQKTRSWWLLEEYLDAHPGIAEDVEKKRQSFFSWLLTKSNLSN